MSALVAAHAPEESKPDYPRYGGCGERLIPSEVSQSAKAFAGLS
jgi:hypothetical protein